MHFVIFQDNFSEDRLYMINEYPDYLNEEYRSMILNVSNPNHSGGSSITNDFQLR